MIIKKSKGMTLIEVIVYVAIFAFVIGAIYSIYYDSAKVAKAGNNYLYNLRYTDLAISIMQRDIREAKEVIPSRGNFVTGQDTLILKKGIKGSYLVYHFDKEREELERSVISAEGTSSERAIGADLRGVRFSYDREPLSDSRLITVELMLKKGALKKRVVTSFPFSVALRSKR